MYAKLVLGHGSPAEQLATAEQFFVFCRQHRIRRLSEWGNPPEAFVKKVRAELHGP